MPDRWTVVFDVQVLRQVAGWERRRQMELDAIQRVLRAEGPAGLDWGAFDLAGFPDWEDLDQPVRQVFATVLDATVYRLDLEIVPGRRVVVRAASHALSPFRR